MPVSDARKRANAKYDAKTYDRLTCKIKKSDTLLLREHVAKRGETINGFLLRAIKDTMARDDKAQRGE